MTGECNDVVSSFNRSFFQSNEVFTFIGEGSCGGKGSGLIQIEIPEAFAHSCARLSGADKENGPPQPALWISRPDVGRRLVEKPGLCPVV